MACSVLEQRIVRIKHPRLLLEHDGDAVAHRVRESIGAANEDLLVLVPLQRPLAERAGEDVEKLAIQG